MNKLLIGLCLIFSLTACGTTKLTDTQTVYVPVVAKCKPLTNITEVEDYFSKAKKEMSLYEKTQLLAAENKSLKGQNIELKAALSECTK
jgi:hypothetical protein